MGSSGQRDPLTMERLSSYLSGCDGDLGRALRLYEWNSEASGAVIRTAVVVEVIVRNAMDRELTVWATAKDPSSWLSRAPLDRRGRADIASACTRAIRSGRDPLVHGKVTAELNFGFWRYLASRRYHASLWVPAPHRAFAGGHPDLRERRRQMERCLADLALVRNRAAHHEPIHRRDLMRDRREAVTLMG